jgi:hypothetical protein
VTKVYSGALRRFRNGGISGIIDEVMKRKQLVNTEAQERLLAAFFSVMILVTTAGLTYVFFLQA